MIEVRKELERFGQGKKCIGYVHISQYSIVVQENLKIEVRENLKIATEVQRSKRSQQRCGKDPKIAAQEIPNIAAEVREILKIYSRDAYDMFKAHDT